MSKCCPLYPRKRTWIGATGMSAFCQQLTHAPQQTALFIRSPRRRIQVEHIFVLRQLGRAGDKVISPLLVALIEGVGSKSRATGYVLSTLRRIIGAAQCQLIEFADSIPARA